MAEKIDRIDEKLGQTREEVAGLKSKVGEMHGWMKTWLQDDRKRISNVEKEQGQHGRAISRITGWLIAAWAFVSLVVGAWLTSFFGE